MMEVARLFAERGTCDRLKVGAIIARDGRVISSGYNGAPAGMAHCYHGLEDPINHPTCDLAVHAEANAIVFAARHGVSVNHAELFTTHQPCVECAKLIINSGISRVTFGEAYRLMEGLIMLTNAGIPTLKFA